MERPLALISGIAFLALTSGQAFAACSDEIATLSPGMTSGSVAGSGGTGATGRVAKDGTLAPLQSGSTTSTKNPGATGSTAPAPAPGQQGVAKDGSTMPLANAPGGGDKSPRNLEAGRAVAAAGRPDGRQRRTVAERGLGLRLSLP